MGISKDHEEITVLKAIREVLRGYRPDGRRLPPTAPDYFSNDRKNR